MQSPTRNRLLTQPVFTITISDPTRKGDPVRGYIVYTVTTRTTSPHYRRGEFSVLRRFSDFLWLVEAVSNNNPGVIVPPMPDKHAFGEFVSSIPLSITSSSSLVVSGRFEEQFVETRRAALQRTLGKMANHPVLSLDPDLKLFLSSDAFSVDVSFEQTLCILGPRSRRFVGEAPSPGNGSREARCACILGWNDWGSQIHRARRRKSRQTRPS